MQPDDRSEHVLYQLQDELHDLCQPLTTLRCRLEIALLQPGQPGLLDAINGALEDTRKAFAIVEQMRVHLLQAGLVAAKFRAAERSTPAAGPTPERPHDD